MRRESGSRAKRVNENRAPHKKNHKSPLHGMKRAFVVEIYRSPKTLLFLKVFLRLRNDNRGQHNQANKVWNRH